MLRLDPHERPPDRIRNVYKKYQKMKLKELEQDSDIIDFTRDALQSPTSKLRVVKYLEPENLAAAFRAFANDDVGLSALDLPASIPVYEHIDMPGLHITPSLLAPSIQHHLLSHLLHRDLSNPSHLTNIHTHYTISYPPSSSSFFSLPPNSPTTIATPLDPTVHKPLTIAQLLNRKIRWTTLGGQYDWTAKQYPDTAAPPFPPDVKAMLEGIFTETRAEAAIVNLYAPGDTLSVHRDVAETSATGLVSLSLGCDAIFVVGAHDRVIALRLASGTAVYMGGSSRVAWHGVPQIVGGTCPKHLADWPSTADRGGEYEEWRGWMAGKRVNLNVRQMWD